VVHYAFSAATNRMTKETAATLAKLVVRLLPGSGSPTLLEGRQGVFHVLIPTSAIRELASK
jgi:hypothetical protein